jgi:hypothetical protein
MNMWFVFASAVTVLVGLIHSILGEKYIISPLQHLQNMPSIFGSDLLTKRTLRFAWHLTTIAWFGLASLMLMLARNQELFPRMVVFVLFAIFATSFIVSLVVSRGRHFSWVMFLAISLFLLLGLRV